MNQVINMKVLILLTLFVTNSYSKVSDEFAEKFTADMKIFKNQCKIQENASQDDFREFEHAKPLSSLEGRCLTACFLEKFEIQKDDKLSLDGGLKAISPLETQDLELYNRIKQILEKCLKEVEHTTGRCDVAGKFYECAIKMAREAV